MRYENVNCIACGKIFTAEDDVVVCPVCGAPHHRACWTASGACAKADAHKEGYAWIFPEEILQQKKAAEEAKNSKREEGGIKLKNGENVVSCPGCGAMCYENDIYCLRCGARLDGTAPAPNDEYADDDGINTDYKELRDDFNRFGGINPDAPVDGIPCWEYAEYVGGGKPGKIIRKVSTMERFGRKTSWNWAALLLGPIWFFWRKMKLEGAIISIIVIFLAAVYGIVQLNPAAVEYYKKTLQLPERIASGEISVTEWQELLQEYMAEYEQELAETQTLGRSLAEGTLEYLLMFGVPFGCALISIPLYRKKTKAEIHTIRGRCNHMDEYVNTLRAEGGTSPGLCVVGVLLMLLALFCALYLPAFISVTFM